MVFQDPFASLNPFHSIEHHIARPLRLHGRTKGREETRQMVEQLLERVNLTPAQDIAPRRPHELSGGQRQRVAIARALAPGAQVVVADEPVSMLDVSIRLGVLNLLARLQREDNLAVLYITHDLATARHFSDDILVMYRGHVVERGPADDVILNPQHSYTRLLASAAPNPDERGRSLSESPGAIDPEDLSRAYDHTTGTWTAFDKPIPAPRAAVAAGVADPVAAGAPTKENAS
jgi:peptide/nickel transport system ATP-binding protein